MVFKDDAVHLLDLVGFRLSPFGLEVHNLFHPLLGEDMMAATDASANPQTSEQLTQPVEGNIRIRGATQDPQEECIMFTHA